jgi:DNA-binding response OmpR family regulator
MARILTVEKHFSLRRLVTIHLVRQGHDVAEADSVASAREILLAASDPFDVMLLDINLPDGSGWEVLREQEQTLGEGHLCVIVMTGLPPTPFQQRRFQPAAIVLKPFSLGALLRLIDQEIACPVEAVTCDTATRPDRERVRSLAR